jgi:hypothetical protein
VTADEITLTLPRERDFHRVAHLVLGGLAVRLDLTFEHLEDLQLALAGLLERQQTEGDVTVTVRIGSDEIEAEVGPFDEAVKRELEAQPDDAFGLRRVLDAVVDGVAVETRDGGHWIGLRKRVLSTRGANV